jgi:prepilin-type N-terminal cleavage/methylation domain-containing protein
MKGNLTRGFTLIELLVVISIISLLSSIVLASLNSARAKAKDAAIKEELKQLQTLATFNYDDYGGYGEVQPSSTWYNAAATCDTTFSGNYALQVRAICKSIVANTSGGPAGSFYAGNSVSNSNNYSFMAWLPALQQYACVGSSGAYSEKTPGTYAYWVGPGCYQNP